MAWAISEEAHLTPVFEIGGRRDGGEAETGFGAELGGGIGYAHTKLGLGIEARGRYLLAQQKAAFDAWGASLTLTLKLSQAQAEFDVGYGLVTHEGTGLLTTYGHLGREPPPLSPILLRRGAWAGGPSWVSGSTRAWRATWCTAPPARAVRQVALDGHRGW